MTTRNAETPLDISGVMIPTTTPFDPVTGEIDLVALRENVRKWARTGVSGLVIGGSTGEAVFLDEGERDACWDVVGGSLPDGVLLVAGTGAESLRTTLRLTRMAAARGADAVLVQPPAFYRGAMSPEVVRDHYLAVAEASPVPVIVYQVPTRFSTLDFPAGLVAELSTHGNVVGIKDSRGKLELVGELVDQCSRGFQVLVGSGNLLYGALESGAVGGILGVANLAPRESAGLHARYMAGDRAAAGALQERIGPLHNAVVGGMGVAGVKYGLELLGYHGGVPRPPLRPLPEGRRDEVAEALARAGILPRRAMAHA
ncbi:MAG: dihydrodipicolinate synthase family protein [Gemmatimonadota bacterium]|nr:dihydrodipicolinate synthase family protein [Gemmatimonadota bacterium]